VPLAGDQEDPSDLLRVKHQVTEGLMGGEHLPEYELAKRLQTSLKDMMRIKKQNELELKLTQKRQEH